MSEEKFEVLWATKGDFWRVPSVCLFTPPSRARLGHVRPHGFSSGAKAPHILTYLTRVPRSKKAEGQARKAAAKEANSAKEDAAQAAIEDAEWEVGGKKGNKKQEADAAKKAAKADRKADADAQVRVRAAAIAQWLVYGQCGSDSGVGS